MKAHENPFASHRIEALAFVFGGGLDWSAAMERLQAADYRGAIVGPKGNGKTTLLLELKAHLEDRGLQVRLERLRPLGSKSEQGDFVRPRSCARRVLPNEILLLDSAGLLGPLEAQRVRRLSKRVRGLVLTSHEPTWLPTWVNCRTTDEQFEGLIRQLIGEPIPEGPAALLSTHQGNVREAFRTLYDRFADS